MENQIFEEDFCDNCGKRVPTDTLEENNENWICQQCTNELEKDADERMQEYAEEQMREEEESAPEGFD